ncbi:MAG: chemotaxis protein CheB [Pseudomonadota bacterium]
MTDIANQNSDQEEADDDRVFLVGIGASAGGLEAIRELVKNLPQDIAATYVVLQHMSPQHKSLLTTLIDRETFLPVEDVKDGIVPKPNAIYVTPPNNDVIYRDGALHLLVPSQEIAAPKPSVDRFFMSAAAALGERSVAVVLSGTGSDGSYGIQAIRAAGGITIAQDDKTAKYDGMPNAAVETGCVDLVLSATDIGIHLSKILGSPRNFEFARTGTEITHPVSDLLQILLARTRVDFRDYKPTTVHRRIERRMTALGIKSQQEYTTHCRSNPREVDALFKDLLISVTRFFRDPDEFMALRSFIDKMVAERREDPEPIRVWLTGCATGEEVYSIAILLAEALGGPSELSKDRVQIFATDIDTAALRIARAGRYSLAASDDIPPELVGRYFVRREDRLCVIDQVKDVILFSVHNLCQDPPFLNVDLICCRNLLIYFGPSLQTKALSRLHFALKPNGLLFLGTAETVGGADDLFKMASEKAHIYRRRVLGRRQDIGMRGDLMVTPAHRPVPIEPVTRVDRDREINEALFDGLARSVGPNAVLVGPDYRILKVYGDVTPFISLTETSRLQLALSMFKTSLANEARALISVARKQGQKRMGRIHPPEADDGMSVQLEVFPVSSGDLGEDVCLVVFRRWETSADSPERARAASAVDLGPTQQIEALEREIAATRDALQQSIEELETSNEELQSTNEELQATNEELQATNEELETSNEELQSTNEELVTVNEELHVNGTELAELSDELQSILETIPSAVVVVDSALQVNRASAAAVELFRLDHPNDRPHISQCHLPPGFPHLAEMCDNALHLGTAVTGEITSGETSYSMRCSPFTDSRGRISGATLLFIETPSTTRLLSQLGHLFRYAPVLLMHRDRAGNVIRLSGHAREHFGLEEDTTERIHIGQIYDEDTVKKVIADDRAFLESDRDWESSTELKQLRCHEKPRWYEVERWRVDGETPDQDSIYVALSNVTDRLEDHLRLQAAEQRLTMVEEVAGIGSWLVDLDAQHLEWSPGVYRIHGISPEEYVPDVETAIGFYHEEDRDRVRQILETTIREEGRFSFEARILQPDHSVVPVQSIGAYRCDDEGRNRAVLGIFRRLDSA